MMENILIVDDQPAICELLSSLFSSHATVRTSGSLEDAKLALSQHNFSLVISDLSLEGRNGREGFELLRFIRSRKPGTKVIIMTGQRTDEIEKEALKLGAAHFLEKPFSINQLLSKVNAILWKNCNEGYRRAEAEAGSGNNRTERAAIS